VDVGCVKLQNGKPKPAEMCEIFLKGRPKNTVAAQ
jgi:hypothetical protein